MKIATMTRILAGTMNSNKRSIKKVTLTILLVVLFFKPVLRAVGLLNEAFNDGLDKVQEKIKKED